MDKKYQETEKFQKTLKDYREKINRLVQEEIRQKKNSEQNPEFEPSFSAPSLEEKSRQKFQTKLEKELEAKSNFNYSQPVSYGFSKGKQFDEAWRNLIHYGDHKLFDEIVHEDYHTINQGAKLNKDTSRRILLKRKGKVVMGPFEILYENHEFLGIQRYSRVNLYTWFSMISCVKYKDGMIYTQSTVREPLESDPSKEEDWNWDDYKP
jgi:hypothetical protein